jgi:hypothetical protein
VASNDPSNPSVNLQVSGTGVAVPVAGADLDIDELKVPDQVSTTRATSITPVLHAKNSGTADGSAPARLVASLNQVQVYDQTITVTLPKGEDGEFPFPPYAVAARASGTLRWTVTIADDDLDVDQAMATTRLGRGDDHGGDHRVSSGASGPSGPSGPGTADATVSGGGMSTASAAGCNTGGSASPVLLLALGALLAGRSLRRRE